MKHTPSPHQRGLSLIGLIMVLILLAMVGLLMAKVVPAYIEFSSVKKAIVAIKASGTGTVRELQVAFDKQADVGYITSITGKDLEITKNGDAIDISFAYQKKIPLFGPASLLLEFEGTTASGIAANKKLPVP